MINHVGFNVSDLAASRSFYEQALTPLDINLIADHEGYLGFGQQPPTVTFWLAERAAITTNCHIAFEAKDRSTVDAFYEAALAAGGTDNGAPGVREIYHPDYYGAFVLDPDGNNVEAVCHSAP